MLQMNEPSCVMKSESHKRHACRILLSAMLARLVATT